MPPANDVPPMTAAAITSSSYPVPVLVTPASSRDAWTHAAMAQRMPISTNVPRMMRLVLIPARVTASGLRRSRRRSGRRGVGSPGTPLRANAQQNQDRRGKTDRMIRPPAGSVDAVRRGVLSWRVRAAADSC